MITTSTLYASFMQSTGISTDTRNIIKGSLFFALKGASFNGNLFAQRALEQGAFKVVVDDASVVKGEDYILVEDTLVALQQLATYHRRQLSIPIIGITGTNGKTTTKELVHAVLSQKYKVFATKGNFNNHIGVPLTLLSMNRDTQIGIVEMGANHLGEIEQLCRIAEPDYGLITNVGKAHLEGFGSFEGVKKTKAELYRYIEQKAGTLFVNNDNNHLKGMLGEVANMFTYGNDSSNGVYYIELINSSTLSFSCVTNEKKIEIRSNLVGGYNLENALAAIAIGSFFDVSAKSIESAINNYIPDNNRSQLVITGSNKVIFDAYNANPTSMMMALSNFSSIEEDLKTVILGEMKELGSDSVREHDIVLEFLRKSSLNHVFLIGKQYQSVLRDKDKFSWFEDVDQLVKELAKSPLKSNFILVKGSRSNRLEQLKDHL